MSGLPARVLDDEADAVHLLDEDDLRVKLAPCHDDGGRTAAPAALAVVLTAVAEGQERVVGLGAEQGRQLSVHREVDRLRRGRARQGRGEERRGPV